MCLKITKKTTTFGFFAFSTALKNSVECAKKKELLLETLLWNKICQIFYYLDG